MSSPDLQANNDLPPLVVDAKRRAAVITLSLFSLLLLGLTSWAAFAKIPEKLDERGHLQQIRLFADGKMELARAPGDSHPANAMLPGYHAAAALYATILQNTSPAVLRSFNMLLFLIFGICFYRHLRSRGDDSLTALELTACICFFPPLFAISNLVYTDVLALLFCLLAVLQARHRRHRTAAACACLALLVRQNLVVLGGLLFLYATWEEHSRAPGHVTKIIARATWPYLMPIVIFGLFVVGNDFRIALDRPSAQPLTLSSGNLLFSLVCFCLWLWPLFLDWLPRGYRRLVRAPRWIPITLAVIIISLAAFYQAIHEWNHLAFMLRNVALYHLTDSLPGRLIFACLCLTAVVAFAGTAYANRRDGAFVSAVWILMLIPALLIEPRYYLPVFTIVFALRIPREAWQLRSLTWAWCLILSAAIQFVQASSDKLL